MSWGAIITLNFTNLIDFLLVYLFIGLIFFKVVAD